MVEIMFRTSFCAVPAFSRVEPAITSAPTGTHTSRSASAASSEPSTHVMHPVSAPRLRAASSAPTTQGERPLALIPTTTSPSDTPNPSTARAPPGPSSSASSLGATRAATGTEKVGSHSIASSAASRPEVPAPAYTSLPPVTSLAATASTRVAIDAAAPATAAGTVASPAFISSTSSSVERPFRSAPAASRASVPSSSKAAMVSQCMQTTGDWSIPFFGTDGRKAARSG